MDYCICSRLIQVDQFLWSAPPRPPECFNYTALCLPVIKNFVLNKCDEPDIKSSEYHLFFFYAAVYLANFLNRTESCKQIKCVSTG